MHVPKQGETKLSFSNPEGAPAISRSFNPAESDKKASTLTLPYGPAAFGTVASAATRRPIEGAEVAMGEGIPWTGRARISRIVRADGQGSWRQQGLREGNYWLAASAPGYSSAGVAVTLASGAGKPTTILLQNP